METFPTYNTGSNVYWKDGKRETYASTGPTGVAPPDPTMLPDLLQIVERLNTMAGQIDVQTPWEAKEAEEWDSQTFYTWIKSNAVNPEFQRLVATAMEAIFGQESRDLSLLYVLAYLAASGDESHPGTFERNFQTAEGAQEERFAGGSQQISLKVAAELGRGVVLNASVRQIAQDAKGVKVLLDKDACPPNR